MDDSMWEHGNVHHLIFAVIIELCQCHPEFLLEDDLGFLGLTRHPITDDGIHGVVGTTAIDCNPAQFFSECPFYKFNIGARMLYHIANFICRIMVPPKVVVPGMDDENIALFDFHALFDHRAGVYIIISSYIAEVDDNAFIDQEIHIQLSHILSGGIEMDLSIQVCA